MQQPSTSEDFVAVPSSRERSSRSKSRPNIDPPPSSGGSEPTARGASPSQPPTGQREDRIAVRAYTLYLERGMAHGNDVDDWLEAERQIAGEDPGPAR